MKIVVETQEIKNSLISQSLYIHNFMEVVKYKKKGKNKKKWIGLDIDKCSMFAHIYLNPDIIVVESDNKNFPIPPPSQLIKEGQDAIPKPPKK